MSESPNDLLGLRARLAQETGLPGADIGIAADSSHLTSGGYHCGGLDLKRINAVGRDDYSIRQSRDRAYYNFEIAHGSNFSSAMDVGDDWPRGGRAGWIRFNNLLRAQLGANDPALAAVRGMNYTPDGTTKRRFDCLTNRETSSTDTVTWHTHIEWWRDTIATAARANAINRIVQLAVAARDNAPLNAAKATGGNDMTIFRLPNGDCFVPTVHGAVQLFGSEMPAGTPFLTVSGAARLAQLCPAVTEPPAVPGAAEIAAAVVAALPAGGVDQATVEAGVLAAIASTAGQGSLSEAAEQGIKNL